MKKNLVFLLLVSTAILRAQVIKPNSFRLAYYGETITHPGFKGGVTYSLSSWEKSKTKKNGTTLKQKEFQLNPSVGFFYHRNYQTALFFIPELAYFRKKENGNHLAVGIGAGYMRTFLPRVYELDSNGEIQSTSAGYNYFVSNFSACFGRDLSFNSSLPMSIYIKPQFSRASPNAGGAVWYFGLEGGITFSLGK